ncbi:MAG: nitroreductase family protein [Bacteroidales bacterium]|jgi:nitroreductase|nr:nitroreductase family protein [Bacteroidales bacterium]
MVNKYFYKRFVQDDHFYFFAEKIVTMIELLRNRRSIRKYTDQQIESEKIELMKEALLRSPSSKNINTWEFIFVYDLDIIQKLKNCKPYGTTPLDTAPLAVVVCSGKTQNDVWVENCSIASILLQLTAQSLGLRSCWIQVRNRMYSETESSENYIKELLGIPENFGVLSIITIGYPAITCESRPFSELQFEKIRINKF